MTPMLGIMASSTLVASGAYESIATANGTGSSGTVTFSSIPATYKHLQIRWAARDTYAGAVIGGASTYLTLNGDSGNNYARHQILGYSSGSVYAVGQTNVSYITMDTASCLGSSANVVGVAIVDILDYASTTKYKTVKGLWGCDGNAASGFEVGMSSGLWMNTAAITSISLRDDYNYTTNSTFALYGIRG